MKLLLSDGHDIKYDGYINEDKNLSEHKLVIHYNNLLQNFLMRCSIDMARLNLDYMAEDFKDKSDSLKKKVEIINKYNFDLAVEIHLNSSPEKNTATGFEIITYQKRSNATIMAKIIENRIKKNMKDIIKVRETKYNPNLYLLRKTKIPTLIIELFFLNNDKDVEMYYENQINKELLITTLGQGIIDLIPLYYENIYLRKL